MVNRYKLKRHKKETSRYIPAELLFEEILVRLPVKSLTIFKSLCKQWRYMIESPSFREAHRRCHSRDYSDRILFSPFKSVPDPVTRSSSLSPSTHSFCFIKMKSIPLDVMLPPEMTRLQWPDFEVNEPWRVSVSVLGPIRTTGVYCIVANLLRCRDYSLTLPNAKISICNPVTGDYKLANPFPLLDLHHCRVHYGFGLAADGDYKVVIVMNRGLKYSSFLSYVYSLKKSTWKKIIDSEKAMVSRLDVGGKQHFPEIFDRCRELCPQVFLNGRWHWMALFHDVTCDVLSFDVDDEAFKSVRGPPGYRGSMTTYGEFSTEITRGVVSVLNNHLAVLYHTYWLSCNRRGVISVWMMMEYGDEESWISVFRVNLECSVLKTLVGISYSLRGDANGVHIQRILFQDSSERLVSCDEFGVVEEQPGFDISSCMFWNNLGISAYSETLELL